MVKRSKKSKSKRVTLRKKYKIIKKVKEHHRKKAKEAKKNLRAGGHKKVEKDPGIPNDWPFKEQELKALEERRSKAQKELEEKKAARKERARQRKLGLLGDENEEKVSETNELTTKNEDFGRPLMTGAQDRSDRAFHKELVKVIEASDIIVEVLDARDPLGTRCIDIEKMIMKTDPTKRIVLLLNKIDLVPREAVEKWLNYLRSELPTVAFKCSTQAQRSNLGWRRSKVSNTSDVPQISDCLGAETLIKLLKNYSRSHELKLSITVGVVGLPNVGKSSLINSLKRSRVVEVGSTPGITRSMQEIQLDKKVKLLDCPGVVMLSSSEGDTAAALRNCKRIEKLDDPITPVKEILKLCPKESLLALYKIPVFDSVDDFLHKVATVRGVLKKGGVVDIHPTARIILHDWNKGKIPYYTLPPARQTVEDPQPMIVAELGKEFDVEEAYKIESSFISGLKPTDDFLDVEVLPYPPPSLDTPMSAEEENKENEIMEMDAEEPVVAEASGRSSSATVASRQHDKLYSVEGILDPRKRKAEKKRRKSRKDGDDMDGDYDFAVDYGSKYSSGMDDEDPAEEDGDPAEDKDGEDLEAMTGILDS